MAASQWLVHDSFKEMLGNAGINLDTDTIKIGLAANGSTVHAANILGYANVTSELTTANGYTVGGKTMTDRFWVRNGSICTFDVTTDPFWDASGAGIVCRYAFIYDDTAAGKPIICTSDLDSGGVTVANGNRLTVQMDPTNGIIALT
jgi:hypothetical protein